MGSKSPVIWILDPSRPDAQSLESQLQRTAYRPSVQVYARPDEISDEALDHKPDVLVTEVDGVVSDPGWRGGLDGGRARQIRSRHGADTLPIILYSDQVTSAQAGPLIREKVLSTYFPKGQVKGGRGILDVIESYYRPTPEGRPTLLGSINRYVAQCPWIDERFSLPGRTDAFTPQEYATEVGRETEVGTRFAAYWQQGELPQIRQMIDDSAVTPSPEADFCPVDAKGDGRPVRWLSLYGLYWEVVRRSPMGERYRAAWSDADEAGPPPPKPR